MIRVARLAAVLAVAGVVLPSVARAQSLWLDRLRPNAVQLEILKPEFSGDDDLTFFSTAWYLSGRAEFSPALHGVVELPFATASLADDPGFAGDGAIVGNPYLGVEFGSSTSGVLGEFGVRPPLATSKFVTSIVALFADTERWSAWIDEAGVVRAGFRMRTKPDDTGLWFEGRIAPELWIGSDASEVWATYGATLRLDRPAVRMGLGVSGRISFEALSEEFGAATYHQFELAGDFGKGRVRPGVSLRMPFDNDLGEVVDAVYGVGVTVLP
jgi:hypothetical protein